MFQPYTRQQLETIAKTRLDGLNVFESRAIEYAARKVRQPFSDNNNNSNMSVAVKWFVSQMYAGQARCIQGKCCLPDLSIP